MPAGDRAAARRSRPARRPACARRCTSTTVSARRRTDGRCAAESTIADARRGSAASPNLLGITVVARRSSVEVGETGVEADPHRLRRLDRPHLDARDGGAQVQEADPGAAADVDDRSVGGIDAGQHVEQLQPEARPTCRWPAGRRTRPSPRRRDRARSTRLEQRAASRTAPVPPVSTASGSAGDSRCTQRGILLPGLALEPAHERVVALGERGEHAGNLVDRVEPVLAFGAALQLADRLCAAQHQHRQHRRLGGIEHQHVGHHVAELGRPVRRAVHGARQPAAAQRRRAPARSRGRRRPTTGSRLVLWLQALRRLLSVNG